MVCDMSVTTGSRVGGSSKKPCCWTNTPSSFLDMPGLTIPTERVDPALLQVLDDREIRHVIVRLVCFGMRPDNDTDAVAHAFAGRFLVAYRPISTVGG